MVLTWGLELPGKSRGFDRLAVITGEALATGRAPEENPWPMADPLRTFFRGFLVYLVPLALLAAAAGLMISGEAVWGVGALFLAGLSLILSRIQLKRAAAAVMRRLSEDERLWQTQKLAALGELAAGIAHEINNPLAIIRQEAEWLGRLLNRAPDFPELGEIRDSLKEIVRQVERSREITHSLLNLARKQEPVLQEVDLNRLLESMALLVERETRPRQIELVRNYQRDLPKVISDGPLLRQVVLNLLNNARQAIEGPGIITLGSRRAGPEHVELVVQDTGRGIPPEHLRDIFLPFFTTKPPGQGTGLGLALCHSIVLKLGGRIRVDSRVGEGTTFTVRLPIKPKEVIAHGEATSRSFGG